MTRFRIAIATAVFAVAAASVPAGAAPPAGVKGGGFIRGMDKAKTTLTISATDGDLLNDKGQAQFVRHTPGTKANPVHITLQCVHVVDSTAIAAGVGADGRMYLVVVKDNGQGQATPDAFAVVELLVAPIYCMGGLVPSDVELGSINGGNFQVSSGA